MSFDIYGNHLRAGYCEVHPEIHEEYPCSICLEENRLKNYSKPQQPERTIEDDVNSQIIEAIAVRDKWWVGQIEKFISYSEHGEKESIGILWKQWQSLKQSILEGKE